MAPRPRVVHLTTVHHPLDPRIFYKQVQSLRRAGFDVHLVAQRDRSDVVDGVPVTALPPTSGRYRRLPLLREAYRAALALEADLYHLHDPELIPVGYALKRKTGAKVVYDMHEDYRWHGPVEGRLIRAMERWCFSWVDHVVVANASEMDVMRGVPATEIANAFLPPPGSAPAPKPTPEGPMELLYAGVQGRARGLFNLLDVARQVQEAELPWRLSLVGACYVARDRAEAEAQIRERHLGGVRRAGWDRYLPWPEMVPFFQAAHVGMALFTPHPNYVRKTLTKFYEYLHFGLPILCSDFPHWRTFIERHRCGAVVDPGRPVEALRVLREWYEKPDLYARLSANAAEAAPRYEWAKMEARLLDLYRRLLG